MYVYICIHNTYIHRYIHIVVSRIPVLPFSPKILNSSHYIHIFIHTYKPAYTCTYIHTQRANVTDNLTESVTHTHTIYTYIHIYT